MIFAEMTNLLTIALITVFASFVRADSPNVVIILADDLGVGDVGLFHRAATGTPPMIETPHMDSLIESGMYFSDGHSSTALCSPSRYCIMTGNLNFRSYAPWGVWGSFRKSPVTDADATLGRIGQAAGLTTGFIGKWHLGGDFMKADGSGIYRGDDRGDAPLPVDVSRLVGGGPQALGFDYSFTMPCGIQGPLYVNYENGEWAPFAEESEIIHLNKDSALYPAVVSDKGPGMGDSHFDTRQVGPLLADKAEAFIREQAGQANQFLLYFCSPMVHIPHLPPDEFDGRLVAGQGITRHQDMIIDFDQQVGRIIDTLKDTGEYENTLIVLVSDNGGLHNQKEVDAGHDASGIYRGTKNHAHEGGHRIPFVAVWPGRIEAGVESTLPVAIHDLPATLASLLGVGLQEDQAMDSLDISDVLLGRGSAPHREDFLLQAGANKELIYRQGDWKLIIQADWKLTTFEPIALFNLADNVVEDESGNFVADPNYADRLQAMLERYLEIRRSGERTTPAL